MNTQKTSSAQIIAISKITSIDTACNAFHSIKNTLKKRLFDVYVKHSFSIIKIIRGFRDCKHLYSILYRINFHEE